MKPCVLFFPTWDSPDLTLLLELLYYEAEFELNTTSGIVDQLQNILNSLSLSKDNIFEITDVDITTGKIILDYICIWISTKGVFECLLLLPHCFCTCPFCVETTQYHPHRQVSSSTIFLMIDHICIKNLLKLYEGFSYFSVTFAWS